MTADVPPELTAEAHRVADELDALMPQLRALLARATDAYSKIRLAVFDECEHWSDDVEETFAERNGTRRLSDLFFDLHELTDPDRALRSEELLDEYQRETWAERLACHGNTEPCSTNCQRWD
jgi:hypothetical protein